MGPFHDTPPVCLTCMGRVGGEEAKREWLVRVRVREREKRGNEVFGWRNL